MVSSDGRRARNMDPQADAGLPNRASRTSSSTEIRKRRTGGTRSVLQIDTRSCSRACHRRASLDRRSRRQPQTKRARPRSMRIDTTIRTTSTRAFWEGKGVGSLFSITGEKTPDPFFARAPRSQHRRRTCVGARMIIATPVRRDGQRWAVGIRLHRVIIVGIPKAGSI